MNFLEISLLNLPESIKDEMRIAQLHGIDIGRYAMRYKQQPEHVREIRLLMQNKLDVDAYRLFTLPTGVLHQIRRYMEEQIDFKTITNKYITSKGVSRLSNKTLEKILRANRKVNNLHVDFRKVQNELVDDVLYGVSKHIRLDDILAYAPGKRTDIIKLLISLRVADINIEPFLQDVWDEERIIALIQGSLIIQPGDLIKEYNITPAFTDSEIEAVIQAVKVNPGLAHLIAYTEDDIPIYNAYQMQEIIEGYRLGLDFEQYYEPTNTDLEMRQIREQLMDQEAKQKGRKFRESLLKQINRPIDPTLSADWNTLMQEVEHEKD